MLKASALLSKQLDENDHISWPAYHASRQKSIPIVSKQALLPVFQEKAASISMIKHAMEITKSVTAFLNPGQIPVFVVDQPLFAHAKRFSGCFLLNLERTYLFPFLVSFMVRWEDFD